jgi:hypothetical protein
LSTSALSSSCISVPVTRVKPAKNLSALMLIESTVGFLYHPAAARSDVKAKKNPLSLLYREPPLLSEDSDIWHKPRREPGDVAEARLLAFPRGSIWYAACHYRSSCQTFGGEIEESCLLVCHFYLPKERADTYRYKNPIGQVSFS